MYARALSTSLAQLRDSRFGLRAVGARGVLVAAFTLIGIVVITFRIPTAFRVTLSDPESLKIAGALPTLGPNFDRTHFTNVRMEAKSRMTVSAVSPMSDPLSMSAIVSKKTLRSIGKEELGHAQLSAGVMEVSSDTVSVAVGKIGGEQSHFLTFPPQIRPVNLSIEKVGLVTTDNAPSISLFRVSLDFSERQPVQVADFSSDPVEVELNSFSEDISGAKRTRASLSRVIARWLGWTPRQQLEIRTSELTDPIYSGPELFLDVSLRPMGENALLRFDGVERLSFMTADTVLHGGLNGEVGFVESVRATVTSGNVRQGFATDSGLKSGDRIEIRSAAELMSIRTYGERTFVVEGRYAFLSINGELVSNTLWGALGDTTRGIVLGILISGFVAWINKRWKQIPRGGNTAKGAGR